MGDGGRMLLVLDSLGAIDVEDGEDAAARRGLAPMFTQHLSAAWRALLTHDVAAYVLVPPIDEIDVFAFLHTARARCPDVPAAVVLGPARCDGAPPRVLWMSHQPVAPDLIDAVLAVAALPQYEEIVVSWDESTFDMSAHVG